MKKYFYSVLAASMLFACSQEDVVDVAKGEGQMVTIQVELPSIESRAIAGGVNVGEGNMATRLIYALYEDGKNSQEDLLVAGIVDDTDNDGKFTVNLTMAKDIQYDVLFMAYNPDNNIFGIASDIDDATEARTINLQALTIKQDLQANQESYDAFVGLLDGANIKDENKTVLLKRPFAQVNALTTLSDLNAVKGLKSEVTTSKLVIKAPNTYNVFTGAATNEVELTYAASDIIQDKDATDYPKNEKFGEDHYYLTLAYVLAGATPDAPSSNHNAKFEFYRADGKCVSKLDILSFPLQRNYRTNVVGDLLTKNGDYTVTIQPGFDGSHMAEPGTKIAVTATELENTDFNQNATFVLNGDFTNVSEIKIEPAEGVEAIIDASQATFGEQIIFKIPGTADHASDVTRENQRKGKYTLTRFDAKTLSVEVYGTSLAITNSNLESLDFWGGNVALDIKDNTIDSKGESHVRYDKHETQKNEYGIYISLMNYDLKFEGNTVTNTASHAVGINGLNGTDWKETINSTNTISSFTGNTISGISDKKNDRAGLKIWDDDTYAPNSVSSLNDLPEEGQKLIETIEGDATNVFIKATGTTYNAYKFNFYDYKHGLIE